MGNSKAVDPLVVLEATTVTSNNNNNNNTEMVEVTRRVLSRSSSSRRRSGGLGRFLTPLRSRGRSFQLKSSSSSKVAVPPPTTDKPVLLMPDRREENGTKSTTAPSSSDLNEAFALMEQEEEGEEPVPTTTIMEDETITAITTVPPQPLVVQVEIGTRDIPMGDECKEEMPEEPAQEESSFVSQHIASLSSSLVNQVLVQLSSFRLDTTESSQDLAKDVVIADDDKVQTTVTPDDSTAAAIVTTAVEEQQLVQLQNDNSNNKMEAQEESKLDHDNENSSNSDKAAQLLMEATQEPSPLSLLSQFEASVPTLLKTMSCANGCNFEHWDTSMHNDKEMTDNKTFEEYDDDLSLPMLLKSQTEYFDVYTVEENDNPASGMDRDYGKNSNKNNDGGLEVMLTLPEV